MFLLPAFIDTDKSKPNTHRLLRNPFLIVLAATFLACQIQAMPSTNRNSNIWSKPLAWFENTFGFPEPRPYDNVRNFFRVLKSPDGTVTLETIPPDGGTPNRRFHVGKFETPSLKELQVRWVELTQTCSAKLQDGRQSQPDQQLTFQHIVGDVGELHRDPQNQGAVFQAASQFNCLEMVSPNKRPEDGITAYATDHTQGPACAIAAPSGTLYRNYFWNGTGQGGQGGHQMDLLQDLSEYLGNTNSNSSCCSSRSTQQQKPLYWKMKNGYALPAAKNGIRDLRHNVLEHSSFDRDKAMGHLRVGVHWDTEVQQHDVTTAETPSSVLLVTQVYCSALPIGYDYTTSNEDWEPFARLVLDSAYEATLLTAAILSRQLNDDGSRRRVKVYLTKLGGGVFRNSDSWISAAIGKALQKYRDEPLDVSLVHYGQVDDYYVHSLK